MKHKRELSKLAKEQMFDSYMKSAIRNYCKEFVRNYFKEKGNTKEVPLEELKEELSTSGPDDNDLLSLFLLSSDNPVDEFINRIKESISDDLLYKSLQQLTDLQIKVFQFCSYILTQFTYGHKASSMYIIAGESLKTYNSGSVAVSTVSFSEKTT